VSAGCRGECSQCRWSTADTWPPIPTNSENDSPYFRSRRAMSSRRASSRTRRYFGEFPNEVIANRFARVAPLFLFATNENAYHAWRRVSSVMLQRYRLPAARPTVLASIIDTSARKMLFRISVYRMSGQYRYSIKCKRSRAPSE